ncbi:hypothetical protein Nepgr_012649 [Nepenthes gracilis]|uniref:Uncharacterized protein n=1 Tax=Nepenthes gracilis TaxID=150966 RepID=A0AAD3SGD7_NEPGR|nr:hypothetical protein Nepgr_012649 [Nepenthes gracilis]
MRICPLRVSLPDFSFSLVWNSELGSADLRLSQTRLASPATELCADTPLIRRRSDRSWVQIVLPEFSTVHG